MQRITVIDSHTAGEPTRVVLAGGPDLGSGPLAQRRERFQQQFDRFRSVVVNEPRGSEVLVGALLLPVHEPTCDLAALFFNNVGYLHMCGHATIGLAVTLGYLGRLGLGRYHLETSVGVVPFEYDGRHRVSLENVPCYRYAARVPVEVPGVGTLLGDVVWGGNWFFLVENHGQALEVGRANQLTAFCLRIKEALSTQGVCGANGAEIDHIELFGPPHNPANHGRNFVLCPGAAYDRSPCGTGTSAKVACLQAEGKLAPGVIWRQEGILGGVFEASYRLEGQQVRPRITGSAYVTAEATLIVEPDDPLAWGA
ncbi:MAG: proline racemase family protein [Gemmataceae bacterium]